MSELVEVTGLLQPNLSMHLACLRECGLVHARRNGRFVYYELADPAVDQLLGEAERVLKKIAKRVQACPRYRPSNRKRGEQPSIPNSSQRSHVGSRS